MPRRLLTAKHVKQLARIVLVLLSGMFVDGFFYSAHAQCAACRMAINASMYRRHW